MIGRKREDDCARENGKDSSTSRFMRKREGLLVSGFVWKRGWEQSFGHATKRVPTWVRLLNVLINFMANPFLAIPKY